MLGHPTKRRSGRPPKGDEALFERVNVRLTRATMARIREIAAADPAGSSEAQVIRFLIEEGLRATSD